MSQQQEILRLEAVHEFLDLEYDQASEFQDIVNFAAELCGTPVALITLLDKDVNWVKVRTGIDAPAMPRETSFCQYTIQSDGLTIIPDTLEDRRFDNNPLVHEPPHVRFYAGAPLTIKGGIRLGSLCLFDAKPNNISKMQQKALAVMARQVTFLMQLELSRKVLQNNLNVLEQKNESLRNIAHIQSHDIRQPLTSIMGIMDMIKNDGYKADKDKLLMIEEAAHELDNRIHAIVEQTTINY
jgi:GAF domain-containing protein